MGGSTRSEFWTRMEEQEDGTGVQMYAVHLGHFAWFFVAHRLVQASLASTCHGGSGTAPVCRTSLQTYHNLSCWPVIKAESKHAQKGFIQVRVFWWPNVGSRFSSGRISCAKHCGVAGHCGHAHSGSAARSVACLKIWTAAPCGA